MTYFQCGPLMTCGGLEWEVESTTVTHSSADWGIFYFPWHRHQIEGTNSFYCLIRKTLASGVNGIAKVPKRKVFTEVGLEPSNVQSPVDALTHSTTAPPIYFHLKKFNKTVAQDQSVGLYFHFNKTVAFDRSVYFHFN